MRPEVKKVSDRNSDAVIIDYNATDFREYWQGKAKDVLHESERKILKKMPVTKNGWLLDLGCGHGRLIPEYYHPNRKIVCVDYALNHLQIAEKDYPQKNIHYITADAYQLPFQPGVFASGICVRLFHHIANPEIFLQELTRVFANQAWLIFSYMNKRNIMRIFKYGKNSLRKEHAQISEVLYATHPEYMNTKLAQHRWEKTSGRGSGFMHQMSRSSKLLDKWIEKHPAVSYKLDIFFSRILGSLNLALMQYLYLKKMDNSKIKPIDTVCIEEILQCPKCHSPNLHFHKKAVVCPSCQATYPKTGKIIDFRIS